MNNPRTLALLAALAGVVMVLIAIVYFAEPAHSLPGFFPGHVGSGSSEASHHHVKHGVAALAVAAAAFAFAWFSTGPASRAGSGPGADAGGRTPAV